MDNFEIFDVAATRLGAASTGARLLWTTAVATGADHALGQISVLTTAAPSAHEAAFSPVEQTSAQPKQSAAARMAAGPLPMSDLAATALPTPEQVATKPNYVHKTRINAGGYGAMGPHPERERLA